MWLQSLGANVVGYSLDPPTQPSLFEIVGPSGVDIRGDVRDLDHLERVFAEFQPDVVFHLAAQAIVLDSYQLSRETMESNVQGTWNVLEAAKNTDCVEAIVAITTDKVYANQGWVYGYRENDRLGSGDPYSTSKAMCELVVESYRNAFFAPRGVLVATARAGNVIGGGDFTPHRLVPDCMKALFEDEAVLIRNPRSVRPWLYVLEALRGYLMLGAGLLEKRTELASAWNFGPAEACSVTAKQIGEKCVELAGSGSLELGKPPEELKEMPLLRLNWDAAAHSLGWQPLLSWEEALEETVLWYRAWHEEKRMREVCQELIERYQVKGNMYAKKSI